MEKFGDSKAATPTIKVASQSKAATSEIKVVVKQEASVEHPTSSDPFTIMSSTSPMHLTPAASSLQQLLQGSSAPLDKVALKSLTVNIKLEFMPDVPTPPEVHHKGNRVMRKQKRDLKRWEKIKRKQALRDEIQELNDEGIFIRGDIPDGVLIRRHNKKPIGSRKTVKKPKKIKVESNAPPPPPPEGSPPAHLPQPHRKLLLPTNFFDISDEGVYLILR